MMIHVHIRESIMEQTEFHLIRRRQSRRHRIAKCMYWPDKGDMPKVRLSFDLTVTL